MAMDKDKRNSNVTISRYGWIAFFLFIIFAVILIFIFKIKYKEGQLWRSLGKRETVQEPVSIRPNRGNIYADDGSLLAASEPLYGIYMDFMADGMKRDTLFKYVTPLSIKLAKKFPDKSALEYRKILIKGWNMSRYELNAIKKIKELKLHKRISLESRHIRLIKKDITYTDLQELYTYPFLNQRSNKSGMYTEEKTTRIKPFGSIAGRTVGSIYKDFDRGGASGLELKYDSILHGKAGIKTRRRVEGRWIYITQKDPQEGLDVQTTLNVDIQSLTEKALYENLVKSDAESGCAVIMETATGEIKGIANLDRISKGTYAETRPNVFSYMEEPGSTFKTVSLMVALDDGRVNPDDTIFVGNGLFPYNGRVVKDWYWRTGAKKRYMTVSQGMYLSSNVVISKMILKAYKNDPMRYVQHIHNLGITKKINWDIPLRGIEGTCRIRYPNDKNNPWSKTTLAWMSFGYETQVPPIYILMFYNGIANGGKMIKPFITKSISKNGEIIKRFKTEVINPSMCKPTTIEKIKKILRGVVQEGTAKPVDSKAVDIAGKTGTAMIASKGHYDGYYVSFCGYFPADHPKYTCFVGMRRAHGSPLGIFKKIAEGVYIKQTISHPVAIASDTIDSPTPNVKNGNADDACYILDELNKKYDIKGHKQWITSKSTQKEVIKLQSNNFVSQLVPNVLGMGAKDAVYLLEKNGLKVIISGIGMVKSQSLLPGSKIIKGDIIKIQLN